jgi:hypothetical protein
MASKKRSSSEDLDNKQRSKISRTAPPNTQAKEPEPHLNIEVSYPSILKAKRNNWRLRKNYGEISAELRREQIAKEDAAKLYVPYCGSMLFAHKLTNLQCRR